MGTEVDLGKYSIPQTEVLNKFVWITFSFAFVFAIHFLLLGRSYIDDFSNEAIHFVIAKALIWNLTDWWPANHSMPLYPAVTVIELNAAILKVFGLDLAVSGSFWTIQLAISVLWFLVCGYWAAVLGAQLRLSGATVALISAICAVHPAALSLPLDPYFLFSTLMLPIGLGLYALAIPRLMGKPSVLLTLPGIGFATTIHYTGLALAASVAFSLIVAWTYSAVMRASTLNVVASFKRYQTYLIVVCCAIAIGSLIFACASVMLSRLAKHPGVASYPWFYLAALCGGVTASLVVFFPARTRPYAIFFASAAVGWVVGVNVMGMEYFIKAYQVLSTQTTFSIRMEDFSIFGLLLNRPWYFVVLGANGIGLTVLLLSVSGRDQNVSSGLFTGTLILSTVGIYFAMSGEAAFSNRFPMNSALYFGHTRYLLGVLAIVPVSIAWTSLHSQRFRLFVFAGGAAITVAALLDYTALAKPHLSALRAFDDAAEKEITDFKKAYPNGLVICGVSFSQRSCGPVLIRKWLTTMLSAYGKEHTHIPGHLFDPNIVGNFDFPLCHGSDLDPCVEQILRAGRPVLMLERARLFKQVPPEADVLYESGAFRVWRTNGQQISR